MGRRMTQGAFLFWCRCVCVYIYIFLERGVGEGATQGISTIPAGGRREELSFIYFFNVFFRRKTGEGLKRGGWGLLGLRV